MSTLLSFSAYIICALTETLPELPSRFTAIVEANIIQKNQTWIMEEWYDITINKAKRAFYYGDMISTTYEDFSDGQDQLWSYQTTHSDTSNAISCTLEPYSANRSPERNDETQSGNLVSSAEWFQFGEDFGEIYLGKGFVVRGINAEAWTRNVTFSFKRGLSSVNESFALTYYFAEQNWDYFRSSMHRVPVRVDLKGERVTDNGTYIETYNFRHYYDYVQFFAEDLTLEDELVLDIADYDQQCNLTLYCNEYTNHEVCTGDVSGDGRKGGRRKGKGGLSAGYIVLMIVLFFVGLAIGALVDRYYVRKRGKASFKRTNVNQGTPVDGDKQTNTSL